MEPPGENRDGVDRMEWPRDPPPATAVAFVDPAVAGKLSRLTTDSAPSHDSGKNSGRSNNFSNHIIGTNTSSTHSSMSSGSSSSRKSSSSSSSGPGQQHQHPLMEGMLMVDNTAVLTSASGYNKNDNNSNKTSSGPDPQSSGLLLRAATASGGVAAIAAAVEHDASANTSAAGPTAATAAEAPLSAAAAGEFLCYECGLEFGSVQELQLHMVRKTAWSNQGLIGCRVSCLVDNREWHEGLVTQVSGPFEKASSEGLSRLRETSVCLVVRVRVCLQGVQ